MSAPVQLAGPPVGWAEIAENLGRAASALEQAASAFERGDERSARSALEVSRGERARLGRARQGGAAQSAPHDAQGIAAMQDVRAHTARVRDADARLDRVLAARQAEAQAQGARVEAEHVVDAVLPRTWDQEVDLAVIVGAGSVELARALADRGQRRVLLIAPEADGELGEVPSSVLVASDLDEAAAACRTMHEPPPERIAYLAHREPGPSAPAMATVRERVDEALSSSRMMRNTKAAFGHVWAKQSVANLPSLASAGSIAHLDQAFRGKPLVVICPGPSLAKNVHLLRELKGKAVLVAVSHALHPLQRAGIEPDLAIAVDPQDLRNHFDGIDLAKLAALVVAVSIHDGVFHLPGARRFLTFAANPQIEEWVGQVVGEHAPLPGGGSVAHSAAALGVRWGCDPIVFVGQDLAYSQGRVYVETSIDGEAKVALRGDGKSYSLHGYSDATKNATMEGKEHTPVRRLLEVPGWDGEPVATSLAFHLYRRWFEEFARLHSGTRFVNCTEGGARIEHMEHRTLASVLAELGEGIDVESTIGATLGEVDLRARQKRVLAAMDARGKVIEDALQVAKRCARIAGELRTRPDRAEALGRAENELKALSRQSIELSVYLQARILQVRSSARDLRREEDARMLSETLYRETVEACRTLLDLYQRGARTLRATLRSEAA